MSELAFGTFVPQGWRMELADVDDPVAQYETLTRCAQEAESAGFDSVWVYDHFHTVPVPSQQPTFEAWTAMAGLARDTHRVRLGQMVTCNAYRPPTLLAKMASCVDVMSRGRLIVGIGAGWYEHEFKAYGYEFGEMPDRLRHLGDAVQVLKAMWSEEEARFEGRHHSVRGAINLPKPVQSPHPPLWIGGGGERVTLKLVARHGDACNFGGDADTVARKMGALRGHCEAAGRDFDQVLKTTNMAVILGSPSEVDMAVRAVARRSGVTEEVVRAGHVCGGADEVAAAIRERRRQGFGYVIFFLPEMAAGGVIRRLWEEVLKKL